MSLSVEKSHPLLYEPKPLVETDNKFVNGLLNSIFSMPEYYEEISSKDNFIDIIQKKWKNSTSYMPENDKKGCDLINAKAHNFIAALSYCENPLGFRDFRNMYKLDHCRFG